jgi:hypothetical protein
MRNPRASPRWRGRVETEAGHPQGSEGRGLHRRLRRRDGGAKSTLSIELKYHDGRPVIDRIERISRPGLRIYRGKDELPKVLGGLGVAVVSTPQGIMTDRRRAQPAPAAKCCSSFNKSPI